MVNSPTTAITLSRPATSESGQLASILQSVLSSLVERSQHADPPTAFLLSKDTHSISWGQSQKSLAVLRDVLKDASGNFRSMEQRRAADLILHTSASLFVVLPTGGGKTILIWLGVVKNRGKVVLVLVPLVSLKQDLLKRARDLGITAAGSTEDLKSSDSLLILVSDAALSSSGIAFVRRLKDNGRLSMVFVDECHVYVTDTRYRPVLGSIGCLRVLEVPFVLLTATAPEHITRSLKQLFFQVESPVIVRASVGRPNLRYSVTEGMSQIKLLRHLATESRRLERSERMIVYFTSISILDEFWVGLESFGCEARLYHSEMLDQEREDSAIAWKLGRSNILLATSGFGLGIDFGAVRRVILVGLPYSFEDYVQQAGRAGRDGIPSFVELFWSSNDWHPPNSSSSFSHLLEFVGASTCRREFIAHYMDGQRMTCAYDSASFLCDICQGELASVGDARLASNPPATMPGSLCSLLMVPSPAASISAATRKSKIMVYEVQGASQVADPALIAERMKAEELISLNQAKKRRLTNLFRFCRSHCALCTVEGVRRSHKTVEGCPLLHGKCLVCLDPWTKTHSSSTCPLKPIFQRSENACRYCRFPFHVGEDGCHTLRKDADGKSRAQCAPDFAIFYCIYLKHRLCQMLPTNLRDKTHIEYCRWLIQNEDGIMNCIHLLVDLLKLEA